MSHGVSSCAHTLAQEKSSFARVPTQQFSHCQFLIFSLGGGTVSALFAWIFLKPKATQWKSERIFSEHDGKCFFTKPQVALRFFNVLGGSSFLTREHVQTSSGRQKTSPDTLEECNIDDYLEYKTKKRRSQIRGLEKFCTAHKRAAEGCQE